MYMGNTLSPHYINKMMEQLENKSVYINVIAKNFETLEPGSHFRILRNYMETIYTKEEMSDRVILTGYIFMLACAISGQLMGVNPFDQEGVEEYKRSMFENLGKTNA